MLSRTLALLLWILLPCGVPARPIPPTPRQMKKPSRPSGWGSTAPRCSTSSARARWWRRTGANPGSHSQPGRRSVRGSGEGHGRSGGHGAARRPVLREATRDPDIEIVRRAEFCLKKIDKIAGPSITASAARVLAQRKQPGAAEVLLNFLPFADDDMVLDEVRHTLAAVAVRDGEPEKVLLDAVEDKLPLRRSAAGEALIRSGRPELLQAMHRLLADPDRQVRLRIALALLDARDKSAVPALIALLGELPREDCWPIEDVLFRMAGDLAPKDVAFGADDASRGKYRDVCERLVGTARRQGRPGQAGSDRALAGLHAPGRNGCSQRQRQGHGAGARQKGPLADREPEAAHGRANLEERSSPHRGVHGSQGDGTKPQGRRPLGKGRHEQPDVRAATGQWQHADCLPEPDPGSGPRRQGADDLSAPAPISCRPRSYATDRSPW